MDISNVLRQHNEILELISKIHSFHSEEQIQKNAAEVSKLLAQLSGIIKIHLASEDKFVYPVLRNHSDTKVKTIAETFAKEMGTLAPIFADYKVKYFGASKIADNPKAFLTETGVVFTALKERISKEDLSLYPLLK